MNLPKQLSNYLNNNVIIVIILFVAAVLRLWFPTQIPFTHDEFSALFRTEFKTFHDLIQFGIKPDGHPALIQVFLFYWVKIFGFNELPVKFPFVLVGIASVYIIYRLAEKWYNQTVALISAAFMASLQYPVMYSQIARPYISGLFFSLLMVYFWTNLIQKPQFQFWRNGLFYVLFSSLCTYNHYFSLLFAFIVGITGLFVLERKYLVKYVLLGVIIFILYIPHFGIFYHQLQTGSVEDWLGKPSFSFLTDYVQYIFHFSLIVGLLVIALILFGLFIKKDKQKWNKMYFLISLIWFLSPIIIGFIYSYAIGSVLQFSVLIFTFPFLLFVLLGHIPSLKSKFNLLIILLILGINIFSLIIERQHYKFFYKSVYEQIIIETQNAQNTYGNNCISIISSSKKISKFYEQKNGLNPKFTWLENNQKPIDFIYFLKVQKLDYLSFGCLSDINPLYLSLITEFFPSLVEKKDYAGGSFYIFSKHKLHDGLYNPFMIINDFESHRKDWEISTPENLIDTISFLGKYSYLMTENQEYSPTYFGNLNQFIADKNDFIDISVSIYSKNKLDDVFIASSLENHGKLLDSRATNVNDYFNEDSSSVWQKAYLSIKLSDIKLKNSHTKLKVFIWNKGKVKFYIDNFEINGRKGNSFVYGLQEKL